MARHEISQPYYIWIDRAKLKRRMEQAGVLPEHADWIISDVVEQTPPALHMGHEGFTWNPHHG